MARPGRPAPTPTSTAPTWCSAPGDRVLVPAGAVHRLGNSGTEPLRVLEIAFGHFDEDDIERLEDDYAR